MYDAPKKGEVRRARHTHYVSLSNGIIYAAQTGLPGYEDDNPADWRPATPAEIERYTKGNDRTVQKVSGDAVDLAAAPPAPTPRTLTLADDDVDAPTPVQAQTTGEPPLPPQLPIGAIPSALPPLAPAFNTGD